MLDDADRHPGHLELHPRILDEPREAFDPCAIQPMRLLAGKRLRRIPLRPQTAMHEIDLRLALAEHGLVHVEEIIRSDDRWEVAGRTAEDDEMSLDIDIRNGRILN